MLNKRWLLFLVLLALFIKDNLVGALTKIVWCGRKVWGSRTGKSSWFWICHLLALGALKRFLNFLSIRSLIFKTGILEGLRSCVKGFLSYKLLCNCNISVFRDYCKIVFLTYIVSYKLISNSQPMVVLEVILDKWLLKNEFIPPSHSCRSIF